MSADLILKILAENASDGAKLAAIATILTGKTTSREVAEVLNTKLRTVERHNTDAKSLVRRFAGEEKQPLREFAEGVRKSAEEDTQICVEISRAPTCAGATKELPSEVVILDNNTPPNPLTVAKPKRERADGPTPMDANTAFHAWNATALRCGLPQAAKLTPDRQRKIIARLKEYGLDGWSQALANIEKSSFLTGGSNTGFRADLDFLVQSKSFGKVHDGGYGNGRHTVKPKTEVRMRPMTAEEIELYRNAGIF